MNGACRPLKIDSSPFNRKSVEWPSSSATNETGSHSIWHSCVHLLFFFAVDAIQVLLRRRFANTEYFSASSSIGLRSLCSVEISFHCAAAAAGVDNFEYQIEFKLNLIVLYYVPMLGFKCTSIQVEEFEIRSRARARSLYSIAHSHQHAHRAVQQIPVNHLIYLFKWKTRKNANGMDVEVDGWCEDRDFMCSV